MLLGYFKVGTEDIFKLTIGNKSLHEISNNIGIRVINFTTSKNFKVESMKFLHRNMHKYTWMFPDVKPNFQNDHVLTDS
jgi:hypothetical protein